MTPEQMDRLEIKAAISADRAWCDGAAFGQSAGSEGGNAVAEAIAKRKKEINSAAALLAEAIAKRKKEINSAAALLAEAIAKRKKEINSAAALLAVGAVTEEEIDG